MSERRLDLARELGRILPEPTTIVCEIGAGHGHFLTAYAQSHPTELCIGIDIIGDRVARAHRKRDRAGLDRLHFLHAEARLFLEQLPSKTKIHRTFVLFPDPWPKQRHHKHRILQGDFLTALHARCTTHAELFFRTDYRPYYDDALSALTAHPLWMVTEITWPFEHRSVFQDRAETYSSISALAQAEAP
ncbi:MAG: tRNA (guanosine(46)-N7)-methyltransferase TrmB [Opitutus sp.]